jgi:hypothetical protein
VTTLDAGGVDQRPQIDEVLTRQNLALDHPIERAAVEPAAEASGQPIEMAVQTRMMPTRKAELPNDALRIVARGEAKEDVAVSA